MSSLTNKERIAAEARGRGVRFYVETPPTASGQDGLTFEVKRATFLSIIDSAESVEVLGHLADDGKTLTLIGAS